MGELVHYLTGYLIPILIIFLAVGFLLSIKFIASRYKKIPPNQVGIFYGRKYKVIIAGKQETRGFQVVSGGGRVLMPLVESYQEMSTAAFQVEIDERDIPNKDNVKLTIKGVATCQISTIPEDLYRAANAFLGKTDVEITGFIRNILKGHLRSIVGKLDINTLLRERDQFNKQVVDESAQELRNFGINMPNLVIQDINDSEGYIDALGKRAVAETKAEAEIKVAEATRDQEISVSNANRAAALVKAENDAKVAEAQKVLQVKQAQFKREADTEKAAADQALAIATAAQEQVLRVAQASRDAAEKEAQVSVQVKEATRRQKELEATVICDATAAQRKTVIDAEAAKSRRILEAQAEAEVLTTTADAKKNAATLEGQGDAARQKAVLVAQAEGAAASKREALLAEATGTKELAAALAQMSESARFILILDKLPGLMDHGGDALAKVAAAIFSSIAAPLGSIDKLEIVDVGGTGRGLDQLGTVVPNILFKLLANAKAQGLDLSKLLQLIGVNPEKALTMLGADPVETPKPVAKPTPKTS
jgi:flotillin